MTDFDRINTPRVQKILDTLDLIAKSARSNRVEGGGEHAAILRPVLDRLADIGAEGAKPDPAPDQGAPIKSPPQNTRLDMALADLAREAPMKDLVRTVAVFLNRLDDLDLENAGGDA